MRRSAVNSDGAGTRPHSVHCQDGLPRSTVNGIIPISATIAAFLSVMAGV
jgi:hypothetical protein